MDYNDTSRAESPWDDEILKTAAWLRDAVRQQYQTREITISCPDDVHSLLIDMHTFEQEVLRVIFLDNRNHVLHVEDVAKGSKNSVGIPPADVFREAVRRSATAIIVAHNHPSGDPNPSPPDVQFTRRLVEAGELLGVEVLDHIVIAGGDFVSLRQKVLAFSGGVS